MSDSPLASIVLPLTGGRLQATRCLEGIARTLSPSFEVIVVDNASVGLQSLLGGLEGDVEVLATQGRLPAAAAFALGCRRTRGQITVLIRDAAAPAAGWLGPLVDALAQPAVGLVASATLGAGAGAGGGAGAGAGGGAGGGGGAGPGQSPLAAWSVAVRTADLQAAGVPEAPDELLVAALCLATAHAGMQAITAPGSAIEPPGARTGGAAQAPGGAPELTIVVPTLDATSARLRRCLAAVAANTEAPHQVVIVENGSPPQGFTTPVNTGVRAADTPYVVVMNDDVEPQPGWWPPLAAALRSGASVCFPLTIEGPMRSDFAAWCFAIARDGLARFSHAPGELFDPSLVVWYQDTDLLHRLRRAGEPPLLVQSSHIRHGLSQTVASEDPQLRSWIASQVQTDRARFLSKHPDAILDGHVLAGDNPLPALKPSLQSAE